MNIQGSVYYYAPRHDHTISFLIALCVHAGCLALGSMVLVRPVEYAVESGISSIEVNLTAAVDQPQEVKPELVEEIPAPPVKDQIVIPKPVEQELPSTQPQVPLEVKDEVKTLPQQSPPISGGAITQLKPNYLKNPAPVYPRESRRLAQEGLVVLSVLVDRQGKPSKADIKRSSGHVLLDNAALKAVRGWLFAAAKIGELFIETTVDVPIRFKLEPE